MDPNHLSLIVTPDIQARQTRTRLWQEHLGATNILSEKTKRTEYDAKDLTNKKDAFSYRYWETDNFNFKTTMRKKKHVITYLEWQRKILLRIICNSITLNKGLFPVIPACEGCD